MVSNRFEYRSDIVNILTISTAIDVKNLKIATDEEIVIENLNFLKNGTVVLSNSKQGLFIKTKDGILKILEIQGENSKKMPIGDFLRGNKVEEFEVFE